MRPTIKSNSGNNPQGDSVKPSKIAKKILSLLEFEDEPVSIKQMQSTLEVPTHLLRAALDQLVIDQQLEPLKNDTFALTENHHLLEGRINAKREGHGLLRTKSGQEISISPRQMHMVWHGDRVQVELGTRTYYGKAEGVIRAVLERAHPRVTGKFKLSNGVGELIPDNPRLPQAILVPDWSLAKVREGDHIAVEIIQFPDLHEPAQGKIVENLGKADSPYVQTELAILRHSLPNKWPHALLEQASSFQPPTEADLQGRVDLRDLPLVTIDSESARDFDDAVFACRKPRGGWRLWVAIADVSHYVPMGSPLDVEALERGTSVYFPHKVVPMLPEQLSNELCSLKPHVDRLAMVCEMGISASGKISKFIFYEAVIRSHARLTYNQVGAYLAGTEYEQPHQPSISQDYPGLCEPLLDLYSLYKTLFAMRQQRGALEFGTTESEFRFDDTGHIKDVVPIIRNDAHRLIEEMMLAANVCTAKLLLKHEAPGIFRNHEPPASDRLESLKESLRAFGAKPNFSAEPEPIEFLEFLNKVADRPDGHILQTLMLRSMSQARYEPECKGHFGLAYPAYTHFTSPIRRYPDLLVHRVIRYLIRNQKGNHVHREKGAKKLRKNEWIIEKPNQLASVAQQNSDCERRADDATRDVVAWLKCSYMKDHIGDSYTGQISGVTHFGLFVTIEELMIDGLVHISSLDQDYYTFNERTTQLVGERTGFVYKIGDPLKIVVAGVSLEDRKIDFALAKTPGSATSKGAKSGKSGKKRRSQSRRRSS